MTDRTFGVQDNIGTITGRLSSSALEPVVKEASDNEMIEFTNALIALHSHAGVKMGANYIDGSKVTKVRFMPLRVYMGVISLHDDRHLILKAVDLDTGNFRCMSMRGIDPETLYALPEGE